MKYLDRRGILGELSLLALFIIFLFLLFITGQPFSKDKHMDTTWPSYSQNVPLPFDLKRPSDKFKLPHYLDEISGISYIGNNKFACIQDEDGIIYFFDIKKGKVTKSNRFGKGRDYEDIVIVNDIAYVLQSNGDLMKIRAFEEKVPDAKRLKTSLSDKNNTEGLTYDYERDSLLIACKGSPHLKKKDDDLKGKRAIFRYDLNSEYLLKEPAYVIDLSYLKSFMLNTINADPLSEKKTTDNNRGNENEIMDILKDEGIFQPSGLAIHPLTKDIYVISSVNRLLVVLNQMGDLITVQRLPKKIFSQPEGICFSPEGDMFISNESKGGRANILRFRYL